MNIENFISGSKSAP